MPLFNTFAFFWLVGATNAAIYLANVTGPVDGLTDTCITVLNRVVACDESLVSADTWKFETDQVLSTMCAASCGTALTTYISRVTAACGSTYRFESPDGNTYSLLYKAELYKEKWNIACLKNANGAFCNAEIRSSFSIDPDTQEVTAVPSPSVTCGDCFISVYQTQLAMPLASNSELASSFTSLTSACSKTGFSVTAPATPKTSFVVSPTTSGDPQQPTCVGDSYTVKSGDTCQSISVAQGMSTAQFMARNNILGYCQAMPAVGTSLCLPENLRCTTHKLVDTDTCSSLASNYEASPVQLISWNPELGAYCDRIPKLALYGFSICVSTPGGTWQHPFPSDEPPVETSTSTTETYFTIPSTAFESLPTPTREIVYPNLGWVPVYGNGTREDCAVYVNPPIILNGTLDYGCANTALAYHVGLADFLEWNPALQNQTSECELSADEQYCAQLHRLQPASGNGITSYCASHQVSEPGTYEYGDCESYLESMGIDEASFKEWNGVGCDGFETGYDYCAQAMHFRPTGQISTCNYWAMANNTGSAGCAEFVSTFGIQLARLQAWNPTLQSDCSGMKKYYDYCIGTPSWHPA